MGERLGERLGAEAFGRKNLLGADNLGARLGGDNFRQQLAWPGRCECSWWPASIFVRSDPMHFGTLGETVVLELPIGTTHNIIMDRTYTLPDRAVNQGSFFT